MAVMLAKHLGVKPEVSTEVPKKAMNSVKDEYIIVDAPTVMNEGQGLARQTMRHE